MSVHNLASYLFGWNVLVLKWLAQDVEGEPIDFPAPDFRWNQLGELAQKFYADFADVPFDRLLEALAVSKREIVTFVSGQTNERLYGEPWYGKHTMGRMIQLNTSSPYAAAEMEATAQHPVMGVTGDGRFTGVSGHVHRQRMINLNPVVGG